MAKSESKTEQQAPKAGDRLRFTANGTARVGNRTFRYRKGAERIVGDRKDLPAREQVAPDLAAAVPAVDYEITTS